LFGNPKVAKQNIDWMINNSNSYGLMPERIYLNNSDCSPASPLSWCSAEFSAALLYYSKVSK
jgi:GH15 family glucan-1,4-alpha-glucosidase